MIAGLFLFINILSGFVLFPTGFALAGTSRGAKLKVLAEKGAKSVVRVTTETKEQITVLVNISAAGSYLKPMVIFPGLTYRNVNLESIDASKFFIGKSVSGWMTADTFFSYIANCLYPELMEKEVDFPVIVFLDGHSSHVNMALSEFCREKRIILYCLPAHASHLMQPLDISVFGPVKQNWNSAIREFASNHVNQTIKKCHFLKIFSEVWAKSCIPEYAINGFKKSGLVPYNPSNMDYSKLIPERVQNLKEKCSSPHPTLYQKQLASKVCYQKCLNVVSHHLKQDVRQRYEERIAEGYVVPDDDETPFSWKVYRDISRLLENAGDTDKETKEASEKTVTEAGSIEITIEASAEENGGIIQETTVTELDSVTETRRESFIELSEVSTSDDNGFANSIQVEIDRRETLINVSSNIEVIHSQNSPAETVSDRPNVNNSMVFQKYDLSPFKEFLRLPEGIVKESRPRRSTDIPPAVGGEKLTKFLAKKFTDKIRQETEKEERRLKRLGKKGSSKTLKKRPSSVPQSSREADVEVEICFACKRSDGDDDDWIGCNYCEKWYHKWCCEDPVCMRLGDEDLEHYIFRCIECEHS